MTQKKTTKVFRTNLINVGLGQGMLETLPYLASATEYNKSGLPISQSSWSADGFLSERIDIEYNENGKVIRETYFAEEGEPSETIVYERGNAGEILKETKNYLDGSADITTYRYDENRRLVEKVTRDDEETTDRIERFTWNENLMISRIVTDGEQNTLEEESFVYDSTGNVTEHKKASAETGEDFKTVREYDEKGQKTVENLYDGEGRLMESVHFTLDDSGKVMTSNIESPARVSETRYFYDEEGKSLGQEGTTGEGNQVLWVEHKYDDEKNLIHSTIFVHGGMRSPGQHYTLDYSYEWFTD